MKRRNLLGMAVFFLALLFVCGGMANGDEVKRISKESLKSILGSGDVIVVDVRTARDYDGSDLQIKGALREDPSQVKKWMGKYSQEKTLVFYCA
jgi:rhodanese-related sulfurtransferase